MVSSRCWKAMQFSRFLPKKFSSRLFLVTMAAGLVPVVIFAVLIDIYGGRMEGEITRIIEKGYEQDISRSAVMLRTTGEAAVYGRVLDVAEQLDMVIQSVPWMTVSDLQKDQKFRELAVQTISRSGYTFVYDREKAMVRFHRDPGLEDKGLENLYGRLPDLQTILEKSLKGPGTICGYYRLPAGDGSIMKRFIYIVPLRSSTADRAPLLLAATVNEDDFLEPIKQMSAEHNETKGFLLSASKGVIESFRHTGLAWMGLGILGVSLIAALMGVYLSRDVTRLRQATARVNAGDLSTPVKPSGSGEVATLVTDFNKMVDSLAATTVSKELLQESEARLREANAKLREEIAARERMEEELLKARKLESLGVLAGGIAHDFNNLLAVIMGNISMGKMLLPEDEKVNSRLAEAERACLTGKDLTYELLAFARGGETLRSVVDPAPFVEGCVRSALGESGRSVSFYFASGLPGISVNEGQMRQVIERIVRNADEAMSDGGGLEVGAEGVALAPDNPLVLKGGEYVHIYVRDEGPGMDPSGLRRVFDPYFTSKQMGHEKGTGLSLSICYSIVRDHDGSITAESNQAKGCTFHIYLPASKEAAVHSQA